MTRLRDAERAIRKLDRKECGYKRRPLFVQWAKVNAAHSLQERIICLLVS